MNLLRDNDASVLSFIGSAHFPFSQTSTICAILFTSTCTHFADVFVFADDVWSFHGGDGKFTLICCPWKRLSAVTVCSILKALGRFGIAYRALEFRAEKPFNTPGTLPQNTENMRSENGSGWIHAHNLSFHLYASTRRYMFILLQPRSFAIV